MTDFAHPTMRTVVMHDGVDPSSPDYKEPPRGAELLCVGKGGVLLKSIWVDGMECWLEKPRLPQSYKDRRTAENAAHRASYDEGSET